MSKIKCDKCKFGKNCIINPFENGEFNCKKFKQTKKLQMKKTSNKTTKLGFEVISIVEIPDTYLPTPVLERLQGKETFVDTNKSINEKIYSGNVFDIIFREIEENDEKILTLPDFHLLAELAKDMINYEFFRVTKI
jgi:hypothetical protein